jgi:hypothetical protein
LSFVNPNTWHLICNNFNLNFIFGIVCLFVCVCTFSLRRESPDIILGDKPVISEVVLSQILSDIEKGVTTRSRVVNFCEHYPFVFSFEPFKVEDALCDLDWVVAM